MAETLVSDAVDLADPFSDGADAYWVEMSDRSADVRNHTAKTVIV